MLQDGFQLYHIFKSQPRRTFSQKCCKAWTRGTGQLFKQVAYNLQPVGQKFASAGTVVALTAMALEVVKINAAMAALPPNFWTQARE